MFCCVHLQCPRRKFVLFFRKLVYFAHACHRTQKDVHTGTFVKSNAMCMESHQNLIWSPRSVCICYIRAAGDRELRDRGGYSWIAGQLDTHEELICQ